MSDFTDQLDKFKTYAQIEGVECKCCGNHWWFDMPKKLECTKCGDYQLKETEVEE